MPFIAAPVIIPEAIRTVLSKFARSRTFSARQVQRVKIILLAADGLDNIRESYKSIDELKAGILRFIEQYNLTAKPFKWTYTFINSGLVKSG